MNGETIREKINWKFQTVHQVHRRAVDCCVNGGPNVDWRSTKISACVRVCFLEIIWYSNSCVVKEKTLHFSQQCVADRRRKKWKEKKITCHARQTNAMHYYIEFFIFFFWLTKTKRNKTNCSNENEKEYKQAAFMCFRRTQPQTICPINIERWETHRWLLRLHLCSRHRWWRAHTVWRA